MSVSPPLLVGNGMNAQLARHVIAVAKSQLVTNAGSGAQVAAVGDITGSCFCNLFLTAVGAANYTTRTAVQMVSDMADPPLDYNWTVMITNTSGGTVTVVAGTGVTLTGTMTIANNTWRMFNAKYTGAGAITLTSVGVGTYS